MEVLRWSVNLAERTDFGVLAWYFLQDGLQRSLTNSVDFTGGSWKFLCSLRVLFGLVEENTSIGASSSCVLLKINKCKAVCVDVATLPMYLYTPGSP